MYGGAAGGGKTVLETMEAYKLSHVQPGNRIAWLRKVGRHFKETCLETWKRFIPPELALVKEHDNKIIVFTEGEPSTILFGGLDRREGISLFSSLEVSSILVDQAEEITEDEFNKLSERLGRWKTREGIRPYGRMILTANPRVCWLKPRFIDNPGPDYNFIKALIKDNPHLGFDYEAQLRETYKNRPDIIKALVEGNWDEFDGFESVIFMRWAKSMFTDPMRGLNHEKAVVSCDVARGGDDLNVIYGFKGYCQTDRDDFGGDKKTYETAARCVGMANKIGANTIAICSTTVGAGVADETERIIKGTGIKLLRFVEAEKSQWPDRYYNLRAEAYWECGKLLNDQKIGAIMDLGLADELCAVNWENRSGRILLEDKKEVKKRLGRSPDKGDAFVVGVWAVAKAEKLENVKRDSSTNRWIKEAKQKMGGVARGYQDMEDGG